MTDLPPGWEWATLGEIASSVKNGIFISRPGTDPNGVTILRISSVRAMQLRLDDVRYSGKKVDELSGQDAVLLPGDLLFTRYSGSREYVGVCARVPEGAGTLTYPDKLIRARVPIINSKYLAAAFASPGVRPSVEAVFRTTAGQVGISGSALKNIRIPIAPLAEQQRIVAALEGHLSRLDAGLSGLAAANKRRTQLHSRILTKLTMPTCTKWQPVTLGDVAHSIRNGMFVSRPGAEPDGVAILRIGSVRPLSLDLKDIRYTGIGEITEDKYALQSGDLLFTRYNGNPEYVGSCAVVPHWKDPLTYPDKLIRVRLNRDQAEPQFIAMACSTGRAREFIRRQTRTTAGQAGIAGRDLRSVPIELPPLDEQRCLVQEYEKYRSEDDRLSRAISAGLSRVEQLRRSLLAETFAGRLVLQDRDDEPASVLLERICAERAAQMKPKRIPRTKQSDVAQETLL